MLQMLLQRMAEGVQGVQGGWVLGVERRDPFCLGV